MNCTISMGKGRARKARLHVTFENLDESEPLRLFLNLSAGDVNETLGELVLNCIDLGVVSSTESLFGRVCVFDDDNGSATELRESVFGLPSQDTLELSRLEIRFGHPSGSLLPLEVDAVCFKLPDGEGVPVRVRGALQLADSPPADSTD